MAALTVVDLSQPWAEAPGYNANNAATTLAAAVNSNTRSYLLLKGGKKVAEYYRPDVSETDTSLMWSTTKSWSSLLIGILVDAGSVSVTSTLETIFPATTNWAAVTDQAAKKAIKLEDLLTMTSGLKDPVGLPSQDSLVEVLNHGTYDASKIGSFEYLATTHILAYVIKHASGGIEPETYALGASGVFPALGVTSGSFSWGANLLFHVFDNWEGVSGSAYGLKMTVRQMAKLGQLYLQNGKASASNQLVSSMWVEQSTSPVSNVGELDFCFSSTEKFTGYGYQFWTYRSKRAGYVDLDYYCAIGHDGQYICVYPSLDAVFATASDQYAGACALLGLIPQLLLDGADAAGFVQTSPPPLPGLPPPPPSSPSPELPPPSQPSPPFSPPSPRPPPSPPSPAPPPPSPPAPSPPPSPPAPSPPPPFPPPPLDQVIMTTTASGELADYTETKRNNISALVASDVAVDASLVTTAVEEGSVVLTSTIIVPQEIEATTVKSALETKWGTSALASDKLSLATGDTISVVAAPMLTINEVGGDSDGMSSDAIIAGAYVGGVIALIVIMLVIWHCNSNGKCGSSSNAVVHSSSRKSTCMVVQCI